MMNLVRYRLSIARTLFFVLSAALIFFKPVFALESQNFRFSVNHSGTDAGELEINIEKQDKRYVITSTSHLSLVASLFLKGYESQTTFEQTDSGWALIQGREKILGEEEVSKGFDVDTTAKTITFLSKDKIDFQPNEWVDAAAFPLVTLLSDFKNIKDGQQLMEVRNKNARRFKFESTVADQIKVNDQLVDTWRIKRNRVGQQGSGVTIWVSQKDGLDILKIEVTKKGKKTVMVRTPS